ncbi:MAG TPA: rRNA maturation RNase YbeY [Candidatus Bipolaricaulota bacterium]|nr:rRNA maturation RNase YbeY [Candidatus Bipolaricaulota bacterium]
MINIEINNQTAYPARKSELLKVAKMVSSVLKIKSKKEASVALVDEQTIKMMNKAYRKKDKVTDVLSFAGEDASIGEVLICLPRAKAQAKDFGHSLKKEIQFLLTHGLLHLLGYDHIKKNDRFKMEALQEKIMAKL